MSLSTWLMENMGTYSVYFIAATLLVALAVQIIMKFITVYSTFYKQKKALRDFPGPEPHWLYGNMNLFPKERDQLCEYFTDLLKDYRKCMQFWLGPTIPQLRLVHPDYIQAICKTAEPKAPMYRYIEPWIGNGLLVSEGQVWARARRLLTPAFHFEILKPYIKVFSESTHIMMNKWKKECKSSESLDMFEHVSLMTLDSILKCAFTYDYSDVQSDGKKNPYIGAVYKMSELAIKRILNLIHRIGFIYKFTSNGREFFAACKTAHELSSSVIKNRQQARKDETYAQNRKYLDFLDLLLDAKDADGNGLTDKEIQNEVDTFMFEGHDTTASGISYCLYNLARHPEYQSKCREEVNNVLGDRDEMEWDDMAQLEMLTMCIKESLRLHPPVPNVSRKITKPVTFPDGKTAPTGTWLAISIFSVHHNPDVWEEPEVYKPERFTVENSKGRSPHAFIPFSAGPRNCIGKHFAMNEMRTSVALILKHFHLSIDENRPIKRLPELILRSKGGLWLRLSPIK